MSQRELKPLAEECRKTQKGRWALNPPPLKVISGWTVFSYGVISNIEVFGLSTSSSQGLW
jgi:hypothetical protein